MSDRKASPLVGARFLSCDECENWPALWRSTPYTRGIHKLASFTDESVGITPVYTGNTQTRQLY